MLAIIGIFGLCMTTIFYNLSLQKLDASFSIVLLFQFMWITILLECLWLKRWPTRQQVVAIVIVMTGTLLAVGLFEQDSFKAIDIAGVGYDLASAVTYGLFLFHTVRLQTDYDPVMKSAMMMLAEHEARRSTERMEGLEESR